MMKKIIILFSFLCTFSSQLFAQFPAAQILQDVYPLNLFNANYSNELFRNKFVQVDAGGDTVVYFVDINGYRAFMAQGAPTDSGGIVNTMYPIKGDGGGPTPVTFEDGVHPGDIFAWDSTAMEWVLYPFPINIYTASGVLTGNRIVGGGTTKSMTFNNLTTFNTVSSGDFTATTTGGGDVSFDSDGSVIVQADDDALISVGVGATLQSGSGQINLDAGTNIYLLSNNGRVQIESGSDQQAVYLADYCDPTENLGIPSIGCVKGLISDSLATAANIYNSDGTLTENRVVTGGVHDLTFLDVNGFAVLGGGVINLESAGGDVTVNSLAGSLNLLGDSNVEITSQINVSQTATTGNITQTASGDITQIATTGAINLSAGTNIVASPTGGFQVFSGTNQFFTRSAGDFIITDNSTGAGRPYGGKYAAAYCQTGDDANIMCVGCTKDMISDSLDGYQLLLTGTTNQTLRFSATNVATATSSIWNTGTKQAFNTTTTPTRYAVNINGNTRINQKLDIGNANGRLRSNATLGVRDSTDGVATVVSIENKTNSIHGSAELWLTSRNGGAHSLIGWQAENSEGNFRMGYGDNSSSNLRLCGLTDTALAASTIIFEANNTLRSVGFSGPVTGFAQVNFQPQDDEGTILPPIQFQPGALTDSKVDGTLMYVDDVIDHLNFVSGTDDQWVFDGAGSNPTLDFGNAIAGQTVSLSITVGGADAGQACVIGAPVASQCAGCHFECQVSAADTVTAYFYNSTVAPINLASGVYSIRVIR